MKERKDTPPLLPDSNTWKNEVPGGNPNPPKCQAKQNWRSGVLQRIIKVGKQRFQFTLTRIQKIQVLREDPIPQLMSNRLPKQMTENYSIFASTNPMVFQSALFDSGL